MDMDFGATVLAELKKGIRIKFILVAAKNTDWLTWIRTQSFVVRGWRLFVWAMAKMEPKYQKKTQFQCLLIHHKSQLKWPPIEGRLSQSDIEI